MGKLLAAVALAAIAVPAAARPAEPAAFATSRAEVQRLVDLLLPDAAMTDLALRAFNHGIEQGTVGDAQVKAYFAQYPGLKDHVAVALRPEMRKIMKRELPLLRDEIGTVIAAELTPDEIVATETFFASPTGQKVYASALQSMGDRPDRDEAEVRSAAMSAVMSNLAPEDYPALMAFGASSAAGKMNSVNPKIAAASKAWADRLVAKNGPRMNRLARKAANKFVKSQKKNAR